ncbi:hypothetical protein CBR_g34700 [Chara braunii]|uniref:PB1 domain-containing protein n=1 Tax=Chara braunii TaxID=69332 RepID=A0A388JYW6_CHABU|nr:hypothetical protein CBR_g34700 [Chara braunii]|eukprot:GBG63000.1 hypothetical protein CBR_g34700 [Chara braunii]
MRTGREGGREEGGREWREEGKVEVVVVEARVMVALHLLWQREDLRRNRAPGAGGGNWESGPEPGREEELGPQEERALLTAKLGRGKEEGGARGTGEGVRGEGAAAGSISLSPCPVNVLACGGATCLLSGAVTWVNSTPLLLGQARNDSRRGGNSSHRPPPPSSKGMGKAGKKKKKVVGGAPGETGSGGGGGGGGGGVGGGAAGGGAPGAKVDPDLATVLKEAHQLKEEGNKCFQSKEFAKALQFYQRGIDLIPEGHADRAVFHSNRAACLMEMKPAQYDEVIRECTLALNVSPRFPRALMRRAKAYEAKGRIALALADVKLVLQNEPANETAVELDRRLRSAVEARMIRNQTADAAATSTAAVVEETAMANGNELGVKSSMVTRMRAGNQSGAVPSESMRGPSLPPRPASNTSKGGLKAGGGNVPAAATVKAGGAGAAAARANPGPETRLANGPAVANANNCGSSDCLGAALEGSNGRRVVPSSQSQPATRADVSKATGTEAASNGKRAKDKAARGTVPLKLYYGHDIRLAEMPVNAGFGELRDVVRKRFPSSKAVLIKYRDSEGDLVTITSRQELRLAEACASVASSVATASSTAPPLSSVGEQSLSGSPPTEPLIAQTGFQPPSTSVTDNSTSAVAGPLKSGGRDALPLLKFHIVEVPPEQEPCILDDDEEVDKESVEDVSAVTGPVEATANGEVSNGAQDAGESGKDSVEEKLQDGEDRGGAKGSDAQAVNNYHDREKMSADADGPPGDEIEIDDWLFDFAQLFRNQLGVDPDGHIELHELGMELCAEALDMVATSEEAQPLFEQAAQKFQEVAALALFNWGNVYMCSARKRLPTDEDEDPAAAAAAKTVRSAEAIKSAQQQYKLAEEKYEEALRIKPDFYEGIVALGQQAFESAKLECSTAPDKKDLVGWDASRALKLFELAEDRFKRAHEMVVTIESVESPGAKEGEAREDGKNTEEKEALTSSSDDAGDKSDSHPPLPTMQSQINIMWGNVLFEHSQVEYRLHKNTWRGLLDKALDKFQQAGCSQDDITSALGNHPCMDSPDAPIPIALAGGVAPEEITKKIAIATQKHAEKDGESGGEAEVSANGVETTEQGSKESVEVDANNKDKLEVSAAS